MKYKIFNNLIEPKLYMFLKKKRINKKKIQILRL